VAIYFGVVLRGHCCWPLDKPLLLSWLIGKVAKQIWNLISSKVIVLGQYVLCNTFKSIQRTKVRTL
jgi:ABC-type antimicrobial peptide transport system permease subunit